MSHWAWPLDEAAWLAASFGFASLVFLRDQERFQRYLMLWSTRRYLTLCALLAFALSWAYQSYYLGGAPRVIDATAYDLQARLLSQGRLHLGISGPAASYGGRFLLSNADGQWSGIFPPGYPLLRAMAYALGAVNWLGPLLAGGLTLATYWLTRLVFTGRVEARLAALLSSLCICLRYHTADSMSHGWCALLLGVVLACLLRGSWRTSVAGGLALGWLLATRPLTGGVAAAVVPVYLLLAVFREKRRRPTVGWLLALGGILGLAVEQKLATGVWGLSTQLEYYRVSDGPPGCFGVGFGAEMGCRGEHGGFVEEYLPNGHGAWEALAATGRRLSLHVTDVGNSVLLAPALVFAWLAGLRRQRAALLVATVLLLFAAYSAFYFDGNIPGGGARLYADVLPLEHALLAGLLVRRKLHHLALPCLLLGFAFSGVWGHRLLSDRQGGSPMFQPELLKQKAPASRLVFVDTDHGFNLGYGAVAGVTVARYRGDAADFLLWQHRGRPATSLYRFDPGASVAQARIEPYVPAPTERFGAGSLWPLQDVVGGWVRRLPGAERCGVSSPALEVRSRGGGAVGLSIELWRAATARRRVEAIVAPGPNGRSLVAARQEGRSLTMSRSDPCGRWHSEASSVKSGTVQLELSLAPGAKLISLGWASEN